MQTDQDTILNSSIISSIESKTNSLFRSIIDDLEEYIDSSSSIELVYDTMIKIDTCIKAIISNAKSTEMSKKELISLYEDKIKEQMNTITFYKTENQKFIDREKSMMKFEKDLFDSKEFRDQDLKYILFQAKRELKEIKTDYKNKELKYLCTIGNQMSQIKSLKQNIEELNTYIENHVTQAEKAKNKKSSLFPHLYRRFEREEINANNKKKKQQPKLYGTRIGRNENKMNLLKQLFKRMDTNMDTYLTEGNTNEHKKGTKHNNYIKKSHFTISHERCLTSPNTFKNKYFKNNLLLNPFINHFLRRNNSILNILHKMEESGFFSRKSSCSPPPSSFPDLDKEMLETSPIKKTISVKTNDLENFVPRLRPKRVYYSTKEIRTFSLDNDDSDCSDTEKEQDNDNNNNQNKDKDKNITSQKKHSVVLSPKNRKLFLLKKLQPNTVQSKKSLFYSHYEDESHNDNDNNTDIQKMNNKLDENDNNPKNENNNNNIEMDYDSDISEKSVDSFSLD